MFHPNGPTFFELARQALSSTEKGYDLLAPKFDYTPFRTPDSVLEVFRIWIEQFGPFESVLDVCCGTGAAMQAIAPVVTKRIVGLDMSTEMLGQAKVNLAELDRTRSDLQFEFAHGNAFQIPFENEFDLAISFGAFGHILPKDESEFVAQIFKSLKPGGRFAFLTTEMPSMLTSGYWLARGFNAAIHVRNLLIRPPFIMYYLTFLWPSVGEKLKNAGFEVTAFPVSGFSTAQGKNIELVKFVMATKSA